MPTFTYHVAPRYTVGEPGEVNESLARRLAEQEIVFAYRKMAKEGRLSVAQADLQGIVYCIFEHQGRMEVRDMLTGEWFSVPLAEWYGQNWHAREDRMKYRIVLADCGEWGVAKHLDCMTT